MSGEDDAEDGVQSNQNVEATYSDQYGDYEVKESLFAGPSGEFAKFESTWEVTSDGGYRLTTVIPYGRGKDK